jgi:hypothetical protein
MTTQELGIAVFITVWGLIGFILWVIMLRTMEKKGETINYFHMTPGPYVRFWKIIKREKTKNKKIKYLILFWLQILMYIGFFIILKLIIERL